MSKGTPSRKTRPVAVEVEGKPLAKGVARPVSLRDIESFRDAVEFLYGRVDLERMTPSAVVKDAYKLDRMRALLEVMGNPHDNLRTVHIAGTKGKGSTCEMLTSCLDACGYSVGLYTSPHIVDVRERMRIGARLISEADFVQLTVVTGQAAAKVVAAHGEATFFELTTAMAFQYFLDQAVDIAVIEVGLGGLLDCTNVIRPEVSAITMIGLDHMQILGNTVEEIAAQKAGIFKAGVPALSVPQEAGVLKVLREKAAEIGAPLEVLGSDIDYQHRFEWGGGAGQQTLLSLTVGGVEYDHVEAPLKGEHQAHNTALALCIVARLVEHGFACPMEQVLTGLESTKLAGRFELAWKSPRIYLDVAHNPDSIKALMKTIGAYLTYDSLVVVFGCASDKDIESMLRHLASGADKVIFTRAQSGRAADPEKLIERYRQISDDGACQVAATVPEALDIAARAAGRGDVICATGSFHIVGETRKRLDEVKAKRTVKK